MTTVRTITLTALLLVAAGSACAQQHIKKAFETFVNDNRVECSETHSRTRNPDTGILEGMLYAYSFTLPASAKSLITNLKAAFREDSDSAYQEHWESAASADDVYKQRRVMYSETEKITLGFDYANYVQMCFADSEHPGYRYAYFLEWDNADGGAEDHSSADVRGRIATAYSRIPTQHGQQSAVNSFDFSLLQDNGNGQQQQSQMTPTRWLMQFNMCRQKYLKSPTGNSATFYVSTIYNLCQKAECLNDTERAMCAEQISAMVRKSSDDLLRTMLNSSIERLKR